MTGKIKRKHVKTNIPEVEKSLEQRKLEAQIEKLNAERDKFHSLYMLKADADARMAEWAISFPAFWNESVRKNRHNFYEQKAEAINVLFEEFGRQLIDAFICFKSRES